MEANRKFHDQELQKLQRAFKKRENLWFNIIVQNTGVDPGEIEDGDLNKLF